MTLFDKNVIIIVLDKAVKILIINLNKKSTFKIYLPVDLCLKN